MGLRLVIPSRTEVDGELSVACPWWQFPARFNVAISHSVPVARMHQRESEGVVMRWGLVCKSLEGNAKFTTDGVVRSDSLQSNHDLRMAWLGGQRGIVPLAGFYLWQRSSQGHLQPYYVRLVNRPVFGIAALWDRIETDQDEVIESCALIAVHANPLLAELDDAAAQMPVILHRDDYDRWLSCSIPQAQELLHPYPQTGMVCHAVGPYVNHLEFDEPLLIKPVHP